MSKILNKNNKTGSILNLYKFRIKNVPVLLFYILISFML